MKGIILLFILGIIYSTCSYSVEVGDKITFFEKKINSNGTLEKNWINYEVKMYDSFLESFQIKEKIQSRSNPLRERFFWVKAKNFISQEAVQDYLNICEESRQEPLGKKFNLEIWNKERTKITLVPACKVHFNTLWNFSLPMITPDSSYFYYVADLPIFGIAALEGTSIIHKIEAIMPF